MAGQKTDVFGGQRREQVFVENPVLLFEDGFNLTVDGFQHLVRVLAIRARALATKAHLFFQAGNADFEEFIEIGAEDQQKDQALQQRVVGIAGLFQYPLIEFQIAQLTIFVVFAIVQINRFRRPGLFASVIYHH